MAENLVSALFELSDAYTQEAYIAELETSLGIKDENDRLLEARLLIDGYILTALAISGDLKDPERLFGVNEWISHLEARRYALEYGSQPLTIDFIEALHQTYLKGIGRAGEPSFVDSKRARGGRFVDGKFGPAFCPEYEIKGMQDNPHVTWEPVPRDHPDRVIIRRGLVHYGGMINYNFRSRDARLYMLEGLCDWYNGPAAGLDPYKRAALLQKQFIALHPLSIDYNGRVSRQLMNWSLVNNDKTPCGPLFPDGDLFANETSWRSTIGASSVWQEICKQALKEGSMSQLGVFGLSVEVYRAYIDTYHPDLPTLPIVISGEWSEIQLFQDYLNTLDILVCRLSLEEYHALEAQARNSNYRVWTNS